MQAAIQGVARMTEEEYRAYPALSYSGIKDMLISPLRFWWNNVRPDREADEPTPAQRIGTALHCAVLQPAEFQARYVESLDLSGHPVVLDTVADLREYITSKGHKPRGTVKADLIAQAQVAMELAGEYLPIVAIEKERFAIENQGKLVLSAEEWQRVQGMAAALEGDIDLGDGQAEACVFAVDPDTGVPLKARIDWLGSVSIWDLKTFTQTRGKSIDQSVHDAIYYEKYYLQAYVYDMVQTLAHGLRKDFILAFVESDQPHETRIKRLAPSTCGEATLYWEHARIEVKHAIRQYADCMKRFGVNQPWRTRQSIDPLTNEEIRQFAY